MSSLVSLLQNQNDTYKRTLFIVGDTEKMTLIQIVFFTVITAHLKILTRAKSYQPVSVESREISVLYLTDVSSFSLRQTGSSV